MVQNIEKDISGVYLIQCVENGKNYIGSAKCIKGRWCQHIRDLNKYKHHSMKLQEDWIKYGSDKFNFTILLECEWSDSKKYEIEYIEKFKSNKFGYNIEDFVDNIQRRFKLTNQRMLQYVKNNGYDNDGEPHLFNIFDMAEELQIRVTDILKHFNVNREMRWNISYEVDDNIYIGLDWDIDEGLMIIAFHKDWLYSA